MVSKRFGNKHYLGSFVVATALVVGVLQLAGQGASYSATGSTVRINAGGPTQTINGTTWSGCASSGACNGYVSGGNPWVQQPAPSVSGYPSDTNAAIHQTEWTGGATNGVPGGSTAFTFVVQVVANVDYDVTLEFTELNKTAAGQRVFDVSIDNQNELSNFDIYQQAGGEFKTITRTFSVHDTNGIINIAFIRGVENAKVDAIQIVPTGSTGSTGGGSTPTTSGSSGFQPATGTNVAWSNIASPPFRSAESSGGIVNNKLYVFGGFQPGSWTTPTKSAAVYNLATNKWSSLPSAPYGLSHAARVIDGHNIILVGAIAEINNSEVWGVKSVLVFNTDNNTWGHLPDLPAARGSGGAALVGRTLHFFGGVDANRNEKADHWALDLGNTGAGWKTAASFPSPRSHFAGITVNDTDVYAIAGMTGWEGTTVEKKDNYKFSTTTGKWTRMADLPSVRSHTGEATMVIGTRIWMFGGEPKFPDATNEIDVYDIAKNTWSKAKATLPEARFAGVADHVGNTVYYVNGTIYSSAVWKGTIY